ncbi:MAG: hypothetical protein ACD_75C02644G0001 [uncultured bacterium]|nr:MAG: hypothetical protein ACD_75C02644G0001 [uncultured bacterium]
MRIWLDGSACQDLARIIDEKCLVVVPPGSLKYLVYQDVEREDHLHSIPGSVVVAPDFRGQGDSSVVLTVAVLGLADGQFPGDVEMRSVRCRGMGMIEKGALVAIVRFIEIDADHPLEPLNLLQDV